MNKNNNTNQTTLLKPRFSKVSFEEFQSSWNKKFPDGTVTIPENVLRDIYNNIKLPQRSTKDSAGYDFFCPKSFALGKGESIEILTGIKCEMPENMMLLFFLDNNNVSFVNSFDKDVAKEHIRISLTNKTSGEIIKVKTGNVLCRCVCLPTIEIENE